MRYQELLEIIKDKQVELRHDVDISIQSAWRMSKFESLLGVKSIYYLRFDSHYYNLLNFDSMKIVDYLIQNHEVGCHVDATNFETNDELFEYLNKYNKIIPFKKFTFHINSRKTRGFGQVENFQNKSILENEYISDSRNNFTIDKFNKIKDSDNFTLCIHPEWWDNKDFMFDDKTIDCLIKSLELENLKRRVLKEILDYE